MVGSIRNFAWVIPEALARGEQPDLTRETFQALKESGVTAILSLRPDREPASPPTARRQWPEYHVEDEQRLAQEANMRFSHCPLTDFAAPPPEPVAAALTQLDSLVQAGERVYVHCRAGAGRAGLISGAWSITRGLSGDDAADNYVHFMEHVGTAVPKSDEEWSAFLRRVGQPYTWWALREIAAALGSPVTRDQPRMLPPERPPDADHWEDGYRALLRPWRRP